MLNARVFIFAQSLPAVGNLLANATLTIKIQTVFARSAHAELQLRQRFFALWTSLQLNHVFFRWSGHSLRSTKMILRPDPGDNNTYPADRQAVLHPGPFEPSVTNVGDVLRM
jgi:hypothetical protein